jgi:hypothetical protein
MLNRLRTPGVAGAQTARVKESSLTWRTPQLVPVPVPANHGPAVNVVGLSRRSNKRTHFRRRRAVETELPDEENGDTPRRARKRARKTSAPLVEPASNKGRHTGKMSHNGLQDPPPPPATQLSPTVSHFPPESFLDPAESQLTSSVSQRLPPVSEFLPHISQLLPPGNQLGWYEETEFGYNGLVTSSGMC